MMYFTLAYKRDLPAVQKLADSLLKHHPQGKLTVVWLENCPTPTNFVNQLFISSLGNVPFAEFANNSTWTELKERVKPFVFHYFLKQHTAAIYVDAYGHFHASPAVLEEFLQKHSGFVVPQQLTAYGVKEENDALNLGIYQNRIIGLKASPEIEHMLEWWQEHVTLRGSFDPCKGFNVDRMALEFAPVLFPEIGVLTHPGVGVNEKNKAERKITSQFPLIIDFQPLSQIPKLPTPTVGQPQLELNSNEVSGKKVLEYTIRKINEFFDRF